MALEWVLKWGVPIAMGCPGTGHSTVPIALTPQQWGVLEQGTALSPKAMGYPHSNGVSQSVGHSTVPKAMGNPIAMGSAREGHSKVPIAIGCPREGYSTVPKAMDVPEWGTAPYP